MNNILSINELPEVLNKICEKATIESFDKKIQGPNSTLKQNLGLNTLDLELCLRKTIGKTKQQNSGVKNNNFNNVEPIKSFYIDADLYLYDRCNDKTVFFKGHFSETYYGDELESYRKSLLLKDIRGMKEYLESIRSKLNILV